MNKKICIVYTHHKLGDLIWQLPYLKAISEHHNQSVDLILREKTQAKNILQDLEQKLKKFNEENRQISSPSLQLELDRRTREVEVQKGIYLTLRQQLELANIEEVQEASIVQILDRPHVALKPSNKSIKTTVLLSGVFGIFCQCALKRNVCTGQMFWVQPGSGPSS